MSVEMIKKQGNILLFFVFMAFIFGLAGCGLLSTVDPVTGLTVGQTAIQGAKSGFGDAVAHDATPFLSWLDFVSYAIAAIVGGVGAAIPAYRRGKNGK